MRLLTDLPLIFAAAMFFLAIKARVGFWTALASAMVVGLVAMIVVLAITTLVSIANWLLGFVPEFVFIPIAGVLLGLCAWPFQKLFKRRRVSESD